MLTAVVEEVEAAGAAVGVVGVMEVEVAAAGAGGCGDDAPMRGTPTTRRHLVAATWLVPSPFSSLSWP